jgi:hypothetical protein
MAPTRIKFIRHAEKPDDDSNGVAISGEMDPESLTPEGWQRAGALGRYFCPQRHDATNDQQTPRTVFAAGVGAGSKSKRPTETVTPLVELLKINGGVEFITTHLKNDHQQLVQDVLTREGIVLVAWEHQGIPALLQLLPHSPPVPAKWPDDRFDIVWILDSAPGGWRFSQRPQMLLGQDRPSVIGV